MLIEIKQVSYLFRISSFMTYHICFDAVSANQNNTFDMIMNLIRNEADMISVLLTNHKRAAIFTLLMNR